CITALSKLPPEHRPRLLRDLTPAHIGLVVAQMQQRGLRPSTIKSTLSSLRKLTEALNQAGWHSSTPTELVPPELYHALHQPATRGGYRSTAPDRISAPLTTDEADGTRFALMLTLIRASGLRHNEIARLREAELDRTTGSIFVRGGSAKGGRERTVRFAPDDP